MADEIKPDPTNARRHPEREILVPSEFFSNAELKRIAQFADQFLDLNGARISAHFGLDDCPPFRLLYGAGLTMGYCLSIIDQYQAGSEAAAGEMGDG